ncbi:hypothetical protein RUND412_007397 [Rhizina undulata]
MSTITAAPLRGSTRIAALHLKQCLGNPPPEKKEQKKVPTKVPKTDPKKVPTRVPKTDPKMEQRKVPTEAPEKEPKKEPKRAKPVASLAPLRRSSRIAAALEPKEVPSPPHNCGSPHPRRFHTRCIPTASLHSSRGHTGSRSSLHTLGKDGFLISHASALYTPASNTPLPDSVYLHNIVEDRVFIRDTPTASPIPAASSPLSRTTSSSGSVTSTPVDTYTYDHVRKFGNPLDHGIEISSEATTSACSTPTREASPSASITVGPIVNRFFGESSRSAASRGRT